jgi:hypothetical protein
MSSKLNVASLALVCLAFLSGCSRSVAPSDIPGVYEATLPSGSEILKLKPSGVYTQQMKGEHGIELAATGQWEFEPYQGEPKIAIHNFSAHFPGSSPQKVDIFLLGAEKSWGRVRLYVNYDLGQYYSKTSNEQ